MVLEASRARTDVAVVEGRTDRGVAADSVVVSTWTTISRVTGLLRLAVIAAVLGPTYMGNTFQAANLVPNAVFEFLTGSLLVNVLVPPLVRYVRRNERRDVERIAGGFLGILTIGFVAVVAVLTLARPLLLHGFTAPVSDPTIASAQRHVGAILLLFILPQIVLYGIAGTAGAVMNANGRFALPAAGPALENVGTIIAVIVSAAMFGSGLDVRHAPHAFVVVLGIGATGAVMLHAGLLWFGCRSTGITLRPRLRLFDPEVRAIVRDLVPTIGQAGLNAMRTMAGLVVGNVVAGGVVAFQLALTFFYFPPALSAKSVGVALIRRLSLSHDDDDPATFERDLGRGIGLTAFITIPAAVAFFVLAHPLVRGLSFGHMATARSIDLAAIALIALAPGVIGESAYILGTYASYARGDARSPLRSALLRTIIAVGGMVVADVYVRSDKVLFLLGAAVTAGNLVGAADLARRLRTALPPRREIAASCARAAAGSAVMAAVSVVTYRFLDGTATSTFHHTAALAMTGCVGVVVYLIVQRLLRSPELALFGGALPGRRLLAPDLTSAIEFEADAPVARKYFTGPDAAARATYEFERMNAFADALAGHGRLDAARGIEVVEGPRPTLRMSRLAGIALTEHLARTKLTADDVAMIAGALHDGLTSYTTTTGEPYYDFHLRNCVHDAPTKRFGLIDFGVPEHFAGAELGSALEVSLGNLVGSTVFEAARPYQLLRRRQRAQTLRVCAAVLASFQPGTDGDPTWAGIERAARVTWDRCAAKGGRVRRLWYRTAGYVLARRAAAAFPTMHIVADPSTQTVVRAAAIGVAVVVAPLAVLSPKLAIATLALATLVTAVAVHPPIAAYVLLGATPLVVGINRGSAIPILRPHEALVLLLGTVLLARAVVGWSRFGFPALRLPPLDVSIALLVFTGSVLPVVWLIARGAPVTRDDFLYAMVMWKYAATYLIVRSAVRSADDVRRCIWLSIAAACVVAILGILQALKLFGVPGVLTHLYAPDGMTDLVSNNRATSTIGNSIAFADVMVINVGLAVAWLLRSRRHIAILLGCIALLCIGAFASGQLSGVIALMVAFAAIAVLSGRTKQLAAVAAVIAVVAVLALQPVIHQRLTHVDQRSGLPQSWIARADNLKTYFLPQLASAPSVMLGVRPAGRVPARESWRDWVYIESGYLWLIWTGGIPLLVAFFVFLRRGLRATVPSARTRAGPSGIAATGAVVALAVIAVLMLLDPHLTMRGTADLTFALLALAVAAVPERFVLHRATLQEASR
jgi:putative peptidoglycan lipid II flippase